MGKPARLCVIRTRTAPGKPCYVPAQTAPQQDGGTSGGPRNFRGTVDPPGNCGTSGGPRILWGTADPTQGCRMCCSNFKNPNDPYHTPQSLHMAFNCSKWIICLCLVFPTTLEKSFLRGELCFLLLLLVNQPSPTGRGPMLEHEKQSPSQSIHNPPPGRHLSLLPSNHLTILFCLSAYYSWPKIPPATICQTTTPPSRVTSSLQSPAQSPRQ